MPRRSAVPGKVRIGVGRPGAWTIYYASMSIRGACCQNPQRLICAAIPIWWKMPAASCSAQAGRKTPCSKSFIFNLAKPSSPDWQVLLFLSLSVSSWKSGPWRVGLQLPRDIIQRRKRQQQMHVLVRCLHVNLQFAMVRPDLDVLPAVHDLHELDVRILLQFFHNRKRDRQRLSECSAASLKCFCGTK